MFRLTDKLLIGLASLIFSTSAFSETGQLGLIKPQYEATIRWKQYTNMGFTWNMPTVGLGIRGDRDDVGLDFALNLAPLYHLEEFSLLKLNANMLGYFFVKEKSRWYMGPGIACAYVHIDQEYSNGRRYRDDKAIIYIQSTFGRESFSKSGQGTFFQAQITTPGYSPVDNVIIKQQFVTLTCGFLF